MLPSLATKDPLFVLGGWRLRKLLIDSPGIRVDVRYAERPTRSALAALSRLPFAAEADPQPHSGRRPGHPGVSMHALRVLDAPPPTGAGALPLRPGEH